ncbi:MAG TPA: tRNA (adenosine(37)-N6)-threonylcarbamoyltransferase complex dimerization subunit type 1 TsaB [Candidatus Saccharimonadales bacterium]|nr:tRNA (adenosine(37)-N6)-threonylcarbamoyltransferase complex dimerization subunit type 1 TsaB [Candidatus Saccharimonadales bacterium]
MAGESAVIVLALRTDRPEVELYICDSDKKLAEIKWQAHLQLAETLNSKIEEALKKARTSYDNLGGIAVFKGPGSFTGLRIGAAVANTISYAQDIPIVTRGGANWLDQAIKDLAAGKNDQVAVPEYGAPPRVTQPRK